MSLAEQIVVEVVSRWVAANPDPGAIGEYRSQKGEYSDYSWQAWRRVLQRVCRNAAEAAVLAQAAIENVDSKAKLPDWKGTP